MMRPRNCIEELKSGDPYWQKLVEVIGEEGQAKAAFDPFFVQFERHFLAARQRGRVVGLIIAFGVPPTHRRQGIGRALQEHVLRRARALGCYQVRSVSRWSRQANHQLKLSMGFAVEPMEHDEPSVAFVMPLVPNHGDGG